jgi:uncharacterized C2H2 Zn-finger protein
MKINYFCEKCGESFGELEYDKCIEHEKNCDKENIFICHMCGKVIRWKNNDYNAHIIEKKCHHFNLGFMDERNGKLDGCDIDDLCLCNDCLINGVIEKCELKEDIYNSGSNRGLDKYYDDFNKEIENKENKNINIEPTIEDECEDSNWENGMIGHDN